MVDQGPKLNGSSRWLKIKRRCLQFLWYAFMASVAAGIVTQLLSAIGWTPFPRSDLDLENLFPFARVCKLIGLGIFAALVAGTFIVYERHSAKKVILAALTAIGVGNLFPVVFALITHQVSCLIHEFGIDLVNVEEALFGLVICSTWLIPVVMVVAIIGSFRRNWREGLVVGMLLQGLGALLVCVRYSSSSDSISGWCFICLTEVLAGGCAGAVAGYLSRKMASVAPQA